MVAYTFRMNAGIPGEVSRFQAYGCTISPEKQHATTPMTAYGQVAIMAAANAGVRPATTGDTVADMEWGFLVRPYPGPDIGVSFPSGVVDFGAGTPMAKGIVDILRRGYMTVKLGGSTAAAKGGKAYVWTAASAGAHVLGLVESVDPTTSGFALNKAIFMGPADASGNTEIAYNI
jgi:hypothetical protein